VYGAASIRAIFIAYLSQAYSKVATGVSWRMLIEYLIRSMLLSTESIHEKKKKKNA
jgi:hypothetical protein